VGQTPPGRLKNLPTILTPTRLLLLMPFKDARHKRRVVVQRVVPRHGAYPRRMAGEAAGPVDVQVRVRTIGRPRDHHALEPMTRDRLPICRRRFGGVPQLGNLLRERADQTAILLGKGRRRISTKPVVFVLSWPWLQEFLLPLTLEFVGHQAVLRFHGVILSSGAIGLVTRPLQTRLRMSIEGYSLALNVIRGEQAQLPRSRLPYG